MMELLQNKEVSDFAFRLFVYLNELAENNTVQKKTEDMAQEFDCRRETVSRALIQLERNQLITKKRGWIVNAQIIYINPQFSVKALI